MIKIFLTIRNRIAITKKCVEALYTHSELPFQLYIYDNCTDIKIKEHFEYFFNLFKEGLATQITFNTPESTFNAFSKAVACNQFGKLHQDDPEKNKYSFLLFLDNDIIVLPKWDIILKRAWEDVTQKKIKDVKVIGQLPGGIKYANPIPNKIAGCDAKIGKLGGSGFWSMRPNFFEDVGYLDINGLVGWHKKHDQNYWKLLDKATGGKPYILGLKKKLCVHCGKLAGSVCNTLSKGGTENLTKSIKKFRHYDNRIESMEFDEFMKLIEGNLDLIKDW